MYVSIHLPYFKQGDDLRHCLENTNSTQEALKLHQDMLHKAIVDLECIKMIVKGHDVEIDADTHHIGISGPEHVIERLKQEDFCYSYEDDDEGCCCDECEC